MYVSLNSLEGTAVVTLMVFRKEAHAHENVHQFVLHLFSAPNLKGRPRKKKPCPQRRDSFSGVKDSNNNSDGKAVAKVGSFAPWYPFGCIFLFFLFLFISLLLCLDGSF